jgi:putative ABC transport system permease protein
MVFFRILKESFQFALHALSVNVLRTILSLLGISIGIFTIVSVFAAVDSLEKNVRNSVASLGSDVVYVQKWPWGGGGGDYPWWKYYQRPEPTYKELEPLKKRANTVDYLAFAFGLQKTVKYRKNSVENATILPVSHEYQSIWGFDIAQGRYFTALESASGTPVALIGSDIAMGLFGTDSVVGMEISAMGRKLRIIGVFAKQGSSLVGVNTDETVLVPVLFARTLMSLSNKNGAFLMAKPKEGVHVDAMKDEIQGAMRSIRRLKPSVDDNFALNEVSVISSGLDALFGVLSGAGWFIGAFSILVGGFGIANIMFVSVRERTNQIGIQMSLGAKSHFILLQFLLESVLLCIIGGLIGLLLIYLLSWGVRVIFEFNMTLSMANVILGITISIIIGLISGIIPAYLASRLDPVEAIRSGQ